MVNYALGRGVESMKDIMFAAGRNYRDMGISQDRIGRRRYMEGMISKETVKLQKYVVYLGGCSVLVGR